MMLAEPKGSETQLLGPFSHDHHFFVISLSRTTEVGMIISENENAKLHWVFLKSI
jgi:hypothetical protein